MKPVKTVFYRDEQNDDFADNGIKRGGVTKDFPFFSDSVPFRIGEFIAYHLIAIPIVAVICFVFSGCSFKNLRAIRKLLKTGKGFFIYANHTHWLDAFLAPLACWPRKAHVIVSPETVSVKGLRTVVRMLGAIPVPTERDAFKPFVDAIDKRIAQGRPVMIFPEAHIWPYCTFVRDFKAGSFRYPVSLGTPSAAVCVTYAHRRGLMKFLRSPRRNIFVSEAFYPDASLPVPLAKQKLRDEVYDWLKDTADAHSDYALVNYVKAE